MSDENLKRRDFIKGAAVTGLSAPLLAGDGFAETSRQNQLSALGQARPVVISSANGANVPKRGVEPRGISCVDLAMRMLKAGKDTLEAVVAGVNIVEDDPEDRKSTRLNSSHLGISYAVFCLKKKRSDH